MAATVMLIPSLSCPARCSYCFSPHEEGTMSPDTLKAAVKWMKKLDNCSEPLEIVFHGGEPLSAGASFFSEALPLLCRELSERPLRFAIQSNLWLLTDELCTLFRDYRVSIGTSLDGPEEINDRQRGEGYFKRSMKGIRLARHHGLNPGAICTFTGHSSLHVEEIFDFFRREELDLTVHGAVPPLQASYLESADVISPSSYGNVLVTLLRLYSDNMDRIRITSIDRMMRSLTGVTGALCTFCDCLGGYLAVGPDGSLYPCQRFAGHRDFSIGNVHDGSGVDALGMSPLWKSLRMREERIAEECGSCPYFSFCRGGCPYNALASGNGAFTSLKDPYCSSYRQVFAAMADSALKELFSEENIAEVVQQHGGTIFRKGRLISLVGDSPHPREGRRKALSILYAAALGMNDEQAAEKLYRAGAATSVEYAELKLKSLSYQLRDMRTFNNLYLHVTFDCNLHCSHCYADAGSGRQGHMSIETVVSLCREASELGFRQAVITGGEPLLHPQREAMLEALKGLRSLVRPMTIVLRTNLSLSFTDEFSERLLESVDQIAISIDGDRHYHDLRRGKGAYDRTVAGLESLARMGDRHRISITAVMPVHDAAGNPGKALQALARKYDIHRLHFKPLLPLGRARNLGMETVPETHWAYFRLEDAVSYGFTPSLSCGLGHNLYVEPDGSAFPCYAYREEKWMLGNLGNPGSLSALLRDRRFRGLSAHTVDSNQGCRECSLRYLCGGACRAWSRGY
ncbi:MAG: TIGR04083 family peptide-modifying radical SAM enzyme [Candidatus Xenobiia bacterium LiM19]